MIPREEKRLENWDDANYASLVISMIKKALVDYTEHNELEFIRDIDSVYLLVPNDYKKGVDELIKKFTPQEGIWAHDKKMQIASNKLHVIRTILEPLILKEKTKLFRGGRIEEDDVNGQQL
jgi:hypothetical protein